MAIRKLGIALQAFLILSIFILGTLVFDSYDSMKYEPFFKYPYQYNISLSEIHLHPADITYIDKLAKEYNVLVVSENSSTQNGNKVIEYTMSAGSFQRFLAPFHINNTATGASTIASNKQSYTRIKDILDNNHYTYKILNLSQYEKDPLKIMATSKQDFDGFAKALSVHLGNQASHFALNSYSITTNDQFYILLISLVSVVTVLFLMNITISLYYFMKQSKIIGTMELLGWKKRNIFYKLYKPFLYTALISVILVFVLAFLFVKNINLSFLLFLLSINVIMIFLTFLSMKIVFSLLTRKKEIIKLLKNKVYGNIMYSLTKILKHAFIFVMMLSLTFIFIISTDVLNTNKENRKFPELDNYTVIYNFFPDNNFINLGYKKQNEISRELYAAISSRFQVFFVEDQDSMLDDTHETYIADKNFIQLSKLQLDSPIQKANTILIPESLRNNQSSILKEFKNTVPVFYKDKKIKTYQFHTIKEYSDSPIIQLYDPHIDQDITMFGNDLNTSLKIKASPDEVYTKMQGTLQSLHLENVLKKESFKTMKEVKEASISYYLYSLYFFVAIGIILLILLIILADNYAILYISRNKKEIMVKKLLGYQQSELYQNFIYMNIFITALFCLLSMILYLVVKKQVILPFIIVYALIPIVDSLFIMSVLKRNEKKSIANMLKGGN